MARVIPYEENHKETNGIMYKKCSICDEWKEMNRENFYHNKANKTDGFNPYCIICTKKRSDEWAHNNWEWRKELRRNNDRKPNAKIKRRESSRKRRESGAYREWQRSKSGKKSMKNSRVKREESKKHEMTDLEWFYCRYYFNNACAYCGMNWEEHMSVFGQDLHKEHVVHDGRNDIKNCVPSCRSCNSEKHTYALNQWYNIHNPKYDRVKYLRIYQWLRWEVLKFVEQKK